MPLGESVLPGVVAASLVFLIQSAAHSGERHVVLTNNTPQPVIEIYVSDDDGIDNWREDRLGSEFLLPGSSGSVGIDDQNGNRRVDVKTVLDNGSSLVKRGVNACRGEGHAVSIQ